MRKITLIANSLLKDSGTIRGSSFITCFNNRQTNLLMVQITLIGNQVN